jgi:peroxiredoxin
METWLLTSMLLLWVIVLVNLLLTLALIRRLNSSSDGVKTGLAVGTKVPDFGAERLTGERETLATYAGQDRIFLFVASQCQPCHELLRTLPLEASPANEELVLVWNGSQQEALSLAREFDIHVPLLLAPRAENAFFETYKVTATPTYCSFDAQGIVRAAGVPNPNDPDWQKLTARWNTQTTLA